MISLTYVILSRVYKQLVTEQRDGWKYQAPNCAQCGIFRANIGIKISVCTSLIRFYIPFYIKSHI